MDPIHQFNIERIVSLHPFGVDASFTNSALFMLIIVVLAASALMIVANRAARGGARAAAVDRGNVLRIRRQHGAHLGRHTRDEVLPFRVHAVHVRPVREPDRAHSLYLHGHEPDHRDRDAGAARLRHRHRLRILASRRCISSICSSPRACRSTSCPRSGPDRDACRSSRGRSPHSVRLFANMLAGHITLQVIAGFVIMLGGRRCRLVRRRAAARRRRSC